ncbi:MAG TPA: hypothetical protein VND95_04220 [Stellaceae bacterium]|nr:hypothetical protein [Stellaceae bacterium]
MLVLSDKWAPVLVSQPETGMGYQLASVILDGRRYDSVTIVGGYITAVKGVAEIPFAEKEIREILVGHGK